MGGALGLRFSVVKIDQFRLVLEYFFGGGRFGDFSGVGGLDLPGSADWTSGVGGLNQTLT